MAQEVHIRPANELRGAGDDPIGAELSFRVALGALIGHELAHPEEKEEDITRTLAHIRLRGGQTISDYERKVLANFVAGKYEHLRPPGQLFERAMAQEAVFRDSGRVRPEGDNTLTGERLILLAKVIRHGHPHTDEEREVYNTWMKGGFGPLQASSILEEADKEVAKKGLPVTADLGPAVDALYEVMGAMMGIPQNVVAVAKVMSPDEAKSLAKQIQFGRSKDALESKLHDDWINGKYGNLPSADIIQAANMATTVDQGPRVTEYHGATGPVSDAVCKYTVKHMPRFSESPWKIIYKSCTSDGVIENVYNTFNSHKSAIAIAEATLSDIPKHNKECPYYEAGRHSVPSAAPAENRRNTVTAA